jgi:hypothetical protein
MKSKSEANKDPVPVKPVHDAKLEQEMEDRFLDAIIAGIANAGEKRTDDKDKHDSDTDSK